MVYSEFFDHNEFNNCGPYRPYASETAFLRIENAFSNFRNAVSGPEKKNRAGMCEERNSSPWLMATISMLQEAALRFYSLDIDVRTHKMNLFSRFSFAA
jgi:hypothetical protein